jgi:hypothetical protein
MINENLKQNIPQANGCRLATLTGKEFQMLSQSLQNRNMNAVK